MTRRDETSFEENQFIDEKIRSLKICLLWKGLWTFSLDVNVVIYRDINNISIDLFIVKIQATRFSYSKHGKDVSHKIHNDFSP